jgi:hypothetical protein
MRSEHFYQIAETRRTSESRTLEGSKVAAHLLRCAALALAAKC